ncbi:MAG: hypothetical protein H0T84_07885 [Tatlockia sp.]|nr:hypothetical protein [Tatlockia sp.]
MNKLKLACIASLLATGLSVNAATPCNGFEIKIKNHLADDLLVTKSSLIGAQLQPDGVQKISAKTEQVYTINNSAAGVAMKGDLILHTISIPTKEVKIQFDLNNGTLACKHTDNSPESDYTLTKVRVPGKVEYIVSNR